MDLRELYEKVDELIGKEVLLQGWIRNHRKQKEFGFIDFNDGTYFKNLQIVYDNSLDNFLDIQKLHIGSAITAKGRIIKSMKKRSNINKLISELGLVEANKEILI